MGSFTESLNLAWDMATRWDPALWQVVALSLQVSGTATVIGAALAFSSSTMSPWLV